MKKMSLIILLLCILKVSSYDYEKQIIAIVEENDKTADIAAYNLWRKSSCDEHDTQIVKWLPDPHTPLGKCFQVVKWDDKTERFILHEKSKPWQLKDNMKTRIQVIGHGRISSDVTMMAGFTHDKVANMLSTLIERGTKNVGRISLVGCSLFGNVQRSCEFSMQRNDFSVNLLESLHDMGIKTEISARNGLVGISSRGKKVHGRQAGAGDDVNWFVKEGSVKKVLLKHTERGELDARYQSYKAMIPNMQCQPLGKSDNVKKDRIEIEETSRSETSYVALNYEESFQVLTSATEMIFNNIVVPNNWDEQITKPVKVQMTDGTLRNLPVRELKGMMDLTKEIKHWGTLGFEYPRKGENGQEISSAHDGTPLIDKKVYFQFGKFILSLNVQAEKFSRWKMNPFYINLVGIIAQDLSDLKGDSSKFTLPVIDKVDYPHLLENTNDEFFPDVIRFLRGDNDNIKSGTANAYNALTAMAMFLSEPIRDWRQHIVNTLMLDLYHNLPREKFGRNVYFCLHPMAHGGASPVRFSGMRYKLYQGSCKWTKKKIKEMKAMFVDVLEKWFSADFEDSSRGIHRRPHNSHSSKSSPVHQEVIKKKFAETLTETISNFDLDKGTGFIHPQQELSLTDVIGPLIHPIDNEYRVTLEEDVWLPFSNYRALRLFNPYTTNIVDYKELERENQVEHVIFPYKRLKNKSIFDLHTGTLTSHDVWASIVPNGRVYKIQTPYSTRQQVLDMYFPHIPAAGGFRKK